jgi:V/A-type H+-transporting ATPase subunit I
MAVLPMKRIQIYGLKKDRRSILDILQRKGVVQIQDSSDQDSVFQKTDTTSEKMQLEKKIAAIEEALEVLDSRVPEKKSMLDSLNGRQELTLKHYEELGKERDKILETAYRLNRLSRQIAENIADGHRVQAQLEILRPWSSLDISMQYQGTKTAAAFIGTLPGEATLEEVYIQLADLVPSADTLHLDIISSSVHQTCIFLLCLRKDASLVESALRSMGFARPSASTDVIPAKQIEELEAEKQRLDQEVKAAREEIDGLSQHRNHLKFLMDYLTMQAEKQEAIGRLLQSKRTFVLSGYIPEREAKAVSSALNERFELFLEIEDPGEGEKVPVLLENNKFAEPVEGVLKSFSYPGKGEIDPSFVMASFYYILFGLMLSDAGYGLLMVIGCGYCLWKFKGMDPGTRKTLRMFYFCGFSTVFWGALFGSWFGDAAKVISTTFFNSTFAIKPLWFEPIVDPMRMLLFSMAVGIVHLFAGLGAKFYQSLRAKQYKDILYDVIFWYVLVGGLVVVMLASERFTSIVNLKFTLPSAAGSIAGYLAAAAAVGIVLTAGRESRNWFKRILKGIYGLYNVTGYMSDILSYSRLLALGLATGVIATVINQMGAMGGGGIFGAIMFTLVFIIGHAINIGINLLGAYVHTNRLSFVEFFGKFYEGGGNEFSPFAAHTKYFKIKEETK